MNWGKIETLFIYLFIVLNAILLTFYIYTVQKNKSEIVQEKEIIERSMKNDNITIEDNPLKKDNLGYINVTISNFNDIKRDDTTMKYEVESSNKSSTLKVTTESAITNVRKNNYKLDLDSFLFEKFKLGASYIFSYYDEKNREIVYDQQIDGIRVFNNKNARIIFKVESNGDIKEFEQTAVGNIRKDKTEAIVTQTQAINRLYHEDLIPKDSKVKATIGYYTYISQTENQVLTPTWKVEITSNKDGNSKEYYVDALSLNILNRTKA